MPARSLLAFVVVAVVCTAAGDCPVYAQVGRSVPNEAYYLAMREYYAGDYLNAERGFQQALRSGIRIGTNRWIDAICYYSMLGEVYYHRGQLKQSLDLHEQALQWHLVNAAWLARIRYPIIAASSKPIRARIGWGSRPTVLGDFPDSMSSLQGTFNVEQAFQVGGAVNPAHLRSVDAVEVMRCLAMSLKRRAELLGPTASLSSLGVQVTNSLSDLAAPSGHYSASFVEALYGLALIGQGQLKSAVPHLQIGAIAGNFDHPLTGIALLEQGKLLLREQKYVAAVDFFHQASVAAAQFGQADIVDEAFRYLTDAYLANGVPGVYPTVNAAVVFAEQEEFYRLAASLRLGAAEVAIYVGDTASASAALAQARVIMARQQLLATDMGARLAYLEAIAQYRSGAIVAADQSIKAALAYMQGGSLKRFHLALVELLYAAGRTAVSPRQMEVLYDRMLREPSDEDWRTEPLESITMLLASHTSPLERWFELLVDRKEYDKALRVAEQLRRHRFYSTLPFGGRILSLRWLVEGEQAMLGKGGLEQQESLRRKYPALAALSQDATRIQGKLRELPLLPNDEEQQQEQRSLFAELVRVSGQQESLIREIALRREPAKLVFPPQPSLSAIQRAIPDNQAVLMFVTTSKGWHAWFVRKDINTYWSIRSPQKVRRELATLLKEFGNRSADYDIPVGDLADEGWKATASEIWQDLVGEFPRGGWDGLEEIVIVPDGVLWYLPFEALQVPAAQLAGYEADQGLLSLLRVRYAPTASLSVGDQRGHQSTLKTTIVGGQLFRRESSQYAGEMLASLKQSLGDIEVISKRKPLVSAGYLAGALQRLIVWNDVAVGGPYQWSPAQFDRTMKHAQLADWIEYPWGAPDQLILPGFHTAAETSLSRKGTGYEIFLAACGLMSTGTRTALISRWRTGGKAPAVLVGEFVKTLPSSSAADAWQTAVQSLQQEMLDPTHEPRLRPSRELAEVSADHPFFWAGYLLLDTGAEPGDAGLDASAAEAEDVEQEADVKEAVDDDLGQDPDDVDALPGEADPGTDDQDGRDGSVEDLPPSEPQDPPAKNV